MGFMLMDNEHLGGQMCKASTERSNMACIGTANRQGRGYRQDRRYRDEANPSKGKEMV